MIAIHSIEDLPVNPKTFAKLIEIVEKESVSFGIAASRIFPVLIKVP